MASEAQIRSEIARLTATINERKSIISGQNSGYSRTNSRNNTYVNPNYKPANKYIRQNTNTVQVQPASLPKPQTQVKPPSTKVKDVVINGVAFESSGRSLVRKDLPKPSSSGPSIPKATLQHQVPFTRKSGHLIPSSRTYKPKSVHSHRGRTANRNMTLHNTTRPYQFVFLNITPWKATKYSSRPRAKRLKYSDKPCPRFTTTGACSRGLTCPYQHDPAKIAICWNFLQGNCSYTVETCALSHDSTPERTPLCLHYLNKGRCTRDNCPFPHVNVGAREGICRDFAVLGYCEKGLDCDKQHVRECPDFAEKGTCSTKGCKLPHVIRANRARKPIVKSADTLATLTTGNIVTGTDSSEEQQAVYLTADNAQLGDEYISLTFKESETEEEDSDEEESEEEDEEDQEGSDPTDPESDSE
ncbi:Zinc finger CCCH domain-containing protein 3 [Termitomyces sp. J132]|nr:Zinc finger CCCH domain-containing protein 3 [Termitomyces sp. J132]